MIDHEIINGDCITVLQELSRKWVRADMIMADPPYNIGLDYGAGFIDNVPTKLFIGWCRTWIAECFMCLADHGSLWLLINHENAADIEIVLRDTGFTIMNWITWYESFGVNAKNKFTRSSRRLFHAVKDKSNFIFNREAVTRPSARQEVYNDKRANHEGRLWDDVWGISPAIHRLCGTHAEREPGFPTQLPLSLLKPIVGCASNPGSLVIDPFGGSGTTSVACAIFGRKSISIEIDRDYVERSRKRLTRTISELQP